MIATPSLDVVEKLLKEQLANDTAAYNVPGLWIGATGESTMSSGAAYFLRQIAAIRATSAQKRLLPLVYNALVRHVTSYDHGSPAHQGGWRSTGTFLKLLGLLPYLNAIGTTHVLLLPFAQRATVGKKGSLGSPYAIKNPFLIDDDLGEPRLDLPIEVQARAFVEACHAIGIKVVAEIVLRTASIDSDLVEHYPEWFYWMVDDCDETAFSAPEFDEQTLSVIHSKISSGRRYQLPEPPIEYRRLFTGVPSAVERFEGGWRGRCPDGTAVRIPGAFADWPPDDPQPAWSDVTYFKLHNHPDLNYMSYNTVRMFDERLESEEYHQHGLWNQIAQYIPHIQARLGIDGVMIDMGHALPRALRAQIMQFARSRNPDFMLWEECFELDANLAHQGIDCVTGYLPLTALEDNQLREFIKRCADNDIPMCYFGAVESHNTPRAGSRTSTNKSYATWLFVSLLPRSLPFILSGYELGETLPMNTGLGFTEDELQAYSDCPLPLFDDVRLQWGGDAAIYDKLLHRASFNDGVGLFRSLSDRDDVIVLPDAEHVLTYLRIPKGERRGVAVLFNVASEPTTYSLLRSEVIDVSVHRQVRRTPKEISISLQPEECIVLPMLLNQTGRIYRERRVAATPSAEM